VRANILCFRFLQRMKHTGENVVRIEAEALRALADRIGGPMAKAFERAVELMFSCAGRVVVTGMGKSGSDCAQDCRDSEFDWDSCIYLHPVEALHGDLGMVVRGDVVLALSASGETAEILALLATIKRLRVPLIAMTGMRWAEFVWRERSRPRLRRWQRLEGSRKVGRNYPNRVDLRGKLKSKAADRSVRSTQPSSTQPGTTQPSCFYFGGGRGCGAGLFHYAGGLLARIGADRFDHDHAGAGRCTGGDFERAARISRKRILPTCILAGSWESGWREWSL
jgi:hypothetical protein